MYKVHPYFRELGKRFGKDLGIVTKLIKGMSHDQLHYFWNHGSIVLYKNEHAFTIDTDLVLLTKGL